MIPTSIDGTDITGATIDGTDVQEITVDGQTVFSAQTLPVAYSNLVAWYPFDSAEYGGSNADDVTALFNPGQSGDSTAYDGTVSGANFQTTGGGTDINAGANSGYYEFDGSNDRIDFGSIPTVENVTELTIMCWVKYNGGGTFDLLFGSNPNFDDTIALFAGDGGGGFVGFRTERNGNNAEPTAFVTHGPWMHIAGTFAAPIGEFYLNGVATDTNSGPSSSPSSSQFFRAAGPNGNGAFADCELDDCRVYDIALSQSQIQTIVNNTPH